MENKTEQCPICEKVAEQKYLWSHVDPSQNKKYDLYQCSACGVEHWFPMQNPGGVWYERDERYANRNIDPTLVPGLQHMIAVSQMQNHKGEILDVGCGNGSFLAYAKKFGFIGDGFDYDRDGIESGKRTFNIPTLYVDDLTGWTQKHAGKKYDWVTFFDVFEHIDNHNVFIEQVKSFMKPDGEISFSIPYSYGSRFILTADLPPRHLTRWSPEAITKFLEKKSFEVKKIKLIAAPFHQLVLKIKWKYGKWFNFGLVGKVKQKEAKEVYINEQGNISYIPNQTTKVKLIHLAAKIKDYVIFGIPAALYWFYLLPQRSRYTDMVIFAKLK